MDELPVLARDVLPPPDERSLLRRGLIGISLVAGAAILGLITDQGTTIRLWAVAVGMLTVAMALIELPTGKNLWLLASATCWLAWPGLPAEWDSARMLVRVLAVLSLGGFVLTIATVRVRAIIISVFLLYHFGNMVMATTSPEPRPWVTDQVMNRLYVPYMRFMYLGNAYHFYSPEPGPSSHLYCLITWELDETEPDPAGGPPRKKTQSGWEDIPSRSKHYKDPLGLAYYRRLSLTELVAVTLPSSITLATFEKNQAWERRRAVASDATNPIPLTPEADPLELQYRVPRADISRWLIPSYARHIAADYSQPGKRVKSIKIYRVEHRVVPMQQFLDENAPADPYTPLSYRPYYLGEYSPEGQLMDPQDPMLYWLTPILPVPGSDPAHPGKVPFIDYMSRHAGYQFEWRERP